MATLRALTLQHRSGLWRVGREALPLLAVAAGGAITAGWALYASVPLVLEEAHRFTWWLALPVIALTLGNVALRFLRWHFLLRRAGVRLEVRRSARIYAAGLAMLLTPAYAGEGVKALLVTRAAPGTLGRVGAVVVAERLLDAVAVALVGGGALVLAGEVVAGGVLLATGTVGAGALLVAPTLGRQLVALASRVRRFPPGSVDGLAVTGTSAPVALALSVLAWTAGCLTLWPVAVGAGIALGPAQAAGTYAAGTLLGGVTLLPAGIGVVGTAFLVGLEGYGATLQQAVFAAALVRLLTTWLTVAGGALVAWAAGVKLRHAATLSGETGDHFEALAPAYGEQLAQAARERVVARKVALMVDTLRAAGIGPGARLLDAGCGPGWYVDALLRHGYRVYGVDLAVAQVAEARRWRGRDGSTASASPFAASSILSLPFREETFDAVYCVNVLHHVGAHKAQQAALAALASAVRLGGVVFVHEINTRNPLFRLYMAYVFPLLKRIDTGTEHWLEARSRLNVPTLRLASTHCYTFLPDFTPRFVFGALAGLERALERSALAGMSAHFTWVLRKVSDGEAHSDHTAGDETALAASQLEPSAGRGTTRAVVQV